MNTFLLTLLLTFSPTFAPDHVAVCAFDAPTRISGTGYMDEDQSPYVGMCGGQLIAYSDGTAYYSDGTRTNGQYWQYA